MDTGAEEHLHSSMAGYGPSTDKPEKSCAYGSCTFVKNWYETVQGARRSADAADSVLKVDICKKCGGLFSSTGSLLPMIVLGAKDKMGQIIQQVYLSGEDYTIYRTRQGVLVNFADCRVREREQRACYAQISEKLCRLRFLTSQMARWPFGLNRNGGFYEHQIAEAMNLAMQVKKDQASETSDLNKASEILNSGLILADERATNENRVRYLIACVLVALVPIITLWLLYRSPPFKAFMPYMLAAAAGAAGAVFSIAMRVQDLDLKPFAHSVMNYVMGAVRVLTGFVAGAIILFIVNGTIFGEGIIKVFKTDSMDILSAMNWKSIILLGFLGGFAERLVPLLLGSLQSGVGQPSASGSPKEAAAGNVTAEAGEPKQFAPNDRK
jgi:hypothetical protein